ncbi:MULTISPECIES: hypothetical protein [Pseudomonas]|uniref:Uncharacterized protein n=1 Tax=Pseudomonas farsensis TaxID=2745492 RepID=A0ABU8QYX3_9PSED|nr:MULTISPECIES: hypothetical protein [Pseudomonas]MBC3411778.1 hypothetical protein [Pseudomonas sp. SWRI51]MBV4530866.1 hypothetical protein [Pseudomonas farsensis]
MSFNLANMSYQERAQIEAEKARLFAYWQANLGKAKAEAGRLIAEKPRRKGKWAEWVRGEFESMSPPEFTSLVRSEVNKMMAAANSGR